MMMAIISNNLLNGYGNWKKKIWQKKQEHPSVQATFIAISRNLRRISNYNQRVSFAKNHIESEIIKSDENPKQVNRQTDRYIEIGMPTVNCRFQ